MTRTFLFYRELQSARNPSSPCKPESPDFIAPYVRSGPGLAMDGEPLYDLDRWIQSILTVCIASLMRRRSAASWWNSRFSATPTQTRSGC